MATPQIQLRPITKDNWLQAASLGVKDSQSQFLSSNLLSIAQSKFESERVALAIYNSENVMVGFVMYNERPLNDGTFRISRMMIADEYQGFGYGKAAVLDVIRRMREIRDCHEITIEISKENHVVRKACQDFGFRFIGEEGSNVLATLKLPDQSEHAISEKLR